MAPPKMAKEIKCLEDILGKDRVNSKIKKMIERIMPKKWVKPLIGSLSFKVYLFKFKIIK